MSEKSRPSIQPAKLDNSDTMGGGGREGEATENKEALSSNVTWTPEHNAYTLWESAIKNDSISDLKESLTLARTFLLQFDTEYIPFRDEVFQDVLSHGSIKLITYMLDHEGVLITTVSPVSIFQLATKPLIEALVTRGWDINTQNGPAFNGTRLIDYFIRARYDKEDLARWIVEEKGARVDHDRSHPSDILGTDPPPILEACAAYGTVHVFKFLEEHGAKPSRRMLHVAVETAASRGADPERDDPADDAGAKWRNISAEMLRFLVDERGLDVNAMDTDIPHRNPTNTYWGTPLCYAARYQEGAIVVKWLIKKGADPAIKDPNSGMDALACARQAKCDEVVALLKDL
ncbi:uncharacterized protein F4822DRAFT_65250 [Hypoxylon trugodes]|uniref:uncharacterized protein n=1 Tax=Hypoxylon trugodes TaxID=326681 RepID=UPI002198A236|nr:uncharacterized protein F4822DRAFT_65250 [Hypoxylon trugodes]KAI1384276.1 hypothetical protein F4822DRAFT_65250 [Hypoxylon trugodes]